MNDKERLIGILKKANDAGMTTECFIARCLELFAGPVKVDGLKKGE